MIPFYQAPDRMRYHGIAWDNGAIWQIVGNDCKRYSEYRPVPGEVRCRNRQSAGDRGFRSGLLRPARTGDARRQADQLRRRHSSRLAEQRQSNRRLDLPNRLLMKFARA